jgi:hypothetical protein
MEHTACGIDIRTEDDDAIIICGQVVRESRKSCAFCPDRAIVQCNGDRCIRQLCNGHRWSPAEDLDLCPSCEHKVLQAAATPKQIELSDELPLLPGSLPRWSAHVVDGSNAGSGRSYALATTSCRARLRSGVASIRVEFKMKVSSEATWMNAASAR